MPPGESGLNPNYPLPSEGDVLWVTCTQKTREGLEAPRLHQLLLVAIQATALLALVGRHLLTLTFFAAGHANLIAMKVTKA
jgi:hypothetical protein